MDNKEENKQVGNQSNDTTNNKVKNSEYYDENGVPKYEELINYENEIRKEIELTTPLVSEKHTIDYLTNEFKNSEYEQSIKSVVSKYKFIRTTRRDGKAKRS